MARILFPEDDPPSGCSHWCEPLHLVERAVAGQSFGRYFNVDHFMFMGKLVRHGRPDVYLNKHYFTRRYLNLDSHGTAYRYVPPRRPGATSDGQYRVHRDLVEAIDHLELPLLPWLFGTDLDEERLGLDYDDRWSHPHVIEWCRRQAARARGARRVAV